MQIYFRLVKCRLQIAVGSLRRTRWGHSGGGPSRGELRGHPGDEAAPAVRGPESGSFNAIYERPQMERTEVASPSYFPRGIYQGVKAGARR